VADTAPEFVRRVTGEIIAGRGDGIPVSLMPADGTWPLGTAAFEKRNLALELVETYQGSALVAGTTYIAQAMIQNVSIRDLVVSGSDTTGIELNSLLRCSMSNVFVGNCLAGLAATDCGGLYMNNVVIQHSTGGNNFSFSTCFTCRLAGCAATNATSGHGFAFSASQAIRMDGCFADDNASSGVDLSSASIAVVLNDCIMRHNGVDGISTAAGSNNVTMDGGLVSRNGVFGINFNGADNLVSSTHVEFNVNGIEFGTFGLVCNCHIHDNTNYGLVLSGDAGCSIANCEIHMNGIDGVAITAGSTYNDITSCFIHDNGARGINLILPAVNHLNLTGNRIINNGSEGIRSAATTPAVGFNSVITNNDIQDNTGSQISWLSSNTVITGNRIKGAAGTTAVDITGSNVVVSSNRISTTTPSGTGIDINATSTNCIVSFNNLRTNATGLSDSGTGTVIIGNT